MRESVYLVKKSAEEGCEVVVTSGGSNDKESKLKESIKQHFNKKLTGGEKNLLTVPSS